MSVRLPPLALVLALLLLLLSAGASPAQAQASFNLLDDPQQPRAQNSSYTSFLASVVTISNDSQFTGSMLNADEGIEPEYGVFTVPLPFSLKLDEALPRLRIEGLLGWAAISAKVDFNTDSPREYARAYADWDVFSGSLGLGPSLGLGLGLRLEPLLQVGAGFLTNDTDFRGPGADELRRLTEPVLNEDAWFGQVGFSLALHQIDWELARVEVRPMVRLDFRRDFRISGGPDVASDDPVDAYWFSARVDFNGPLLSFCATKEPAGQDGEEEQDQPPAELRWVGQLGYRRYFDDLVDVLGFDDFWGVGGGVAFRNVETLVVEELRVFGQLFLGDDVSGWGLVVDARF